MKKPLQAPRGTRDILGEEEKLQTYIYNRVRENMGVFGAERIETPVFEFAETFTAAIGKGTDIVDKEMFEVRRLGAAEMLDGDISKPLVLRPEYTAGIARAYLQSGMATLPQPVKLWYFGPAFRYERPQSGRYRIHNQFGIEVLGDPEPLSDALVIFLAIKTLEDLGLKNLLLNINSIGDKSCRPKMKKKLVEYFQGYLENLCSDCNRRFVENPLRILDCKQENCQKIIAGAPQLLDMLCDPCKNHFKETLENLESLEIPYNLNPRLVRGLDYYTRTVFEIGLGEAENGLTLLGGGRYDDLIELLGGEPTPAIGWAAGVERVLEALREGGLELKPEKKSDICLIHMGEKAKKQTLGLLATLCREGFRVTTVIGKDSLKSQLRSADKLGAKICLIIGQREYIDKTVIFKDMTAGSQETLAQEKLVDYIKKHLN